jgi:uncharacterized membrane protein YbhN (UPF0104 family)
MRRLILIIIAVAALAAVVFYVDFTTFYEAIRGLDRQTLLLLSVLLGISAAVKAVRWAFYLRAARLDISWGDGMKSYLGGMSAGALPGGSWLPPRLAQEHGTVHMREAAAALFVGFVADMIALSLLAWASMFALRQEGPRFLLPTAGVVLATILIGMGRSERLWYFIYRLLARFRVTRGLLPKEADIHGRVRALMRPAVVARGVGFCIVTTLLSGSVIYLLANGLTFRGVSPLEALYVQSASENAAIVMPVPGGIGVSDSSAAGMLNSLSIGWVRATFIVLTIRSVDILFKTTVGAFFLVLFYHRLLWSVVALQRRSRVARYHMRRAWRRGNQVAGWGSWRGTVDSLRHPRRPRKQPRDLEA